MAAPYEDNDLRHSYSIDTYYPQQAGRENCVRHILTNADVIMKDQEQNPEELIYSLTSLSLICVLVHK